MIKLGDNMLVNFNEMLKKAKENHYAVPHLNINNLEWTKYILEECQELDVPVILGVSEGAAKYMGGFEAITGMVRGLIKDLNISIPVCLHVDHGQSFETCKKAIDAGFTSVMIDASKLELDENVRVLFYEKDSYAVKLLTKDGDEVILYHGKRGFSFDDTYEMIYNRQKESLFEDTDTIKIVNLNFKSESNYKTLTGKEFYDINGVFHEIDEVVQTITFNLDNTGGKVKSETGMGVSNSVHESRYFDFTDNFVLFLKQNNKDKPYFAVNIVDIEEFSSK